MQYSLAVAKLIPQRRKIAARINVHLQVTVMVSGGKNVLYNARSLYFEPCFAVKPAVAQIIHHVAEGRHVGAFVRIELYGDAVPSAAEKGSDLDPVRGIAAEMGAGVHAVDVKSHHVRRTVKADKIPLRFVLYIDRPAVAENAAVFLGIGTVQRKLAHIMGKTDAFHSLRRGLAPQEAFARIADEFPIVA